jgi:hypothetical protein
LPLHKLERYTREGDRELIQMMYTIVGCPCFLLDVPRGPFYRLKGPRSSWNPFWKAILAFCRVAHRTVRCTTGHEQCLSGARSPSFSGEADRCAFRPFGAPDSPVHPLTVGSGHTSPVDYGVDRWLGRLRPTGQFGAPPDSPVNFSHDSP